MTERNIYIEPEERVLLRTADVYQTESVDDVASYSARLLEIVADFRNSGRPEGFNAQSMVGKSKRGEVACRLFARIDPETGIIEAAGFKTRGCLAMTGCASAACILIEGKPIDEPLSLTIDDVREYVDGVPSGKVNTLHFAVCAIRALVGDFLLRDGLPYSEVEAATGCDEGSISCIMAEHCSHRQSMMEARMDALEAERAAQRETALALALDLVRERTQARQLTCPADWAHLVPDCMLASEFQDALLEVVDGASEAAADGAAGEGGAVRKRSKFANRGVGIPAFGAKRTEQPAAAAEGAPEVAAEDASAPEGASVLDDIPHVYDYSRSAADEDDDAELIPPEGYELVQVDGEWGLVKTDKPAVPKVRTPDACGIRKLGSTDGVRLYDGRQMTDAYARWAYVAEADDPVHTFAFCVREDSRVYPRPLAEESLANEPFCMSPDEVRRAWAAAQAQAEYADIQSVSASNGDVYYYSTKHLTPDHATSLAEWSSVGRFYNV